MRLLGGFTRVKLPIICTCPTFIIIGRTKSHVRSLTYENQFVAARPLSNVDLSRSGW